MVYRRCRMAANLTGIDGFPFDVKASTDFCESAENSAKLCMRAREKLDSIFGFLPGFTLYVLNKKDWASVASNPKYGICQIFKLDFYSIITFLFY